MAGDHEHRRLLHDRQLRRGRAGLRIEYLSYVGARYLMPPRHAPADESARAAPESGITARRRAKAAKEASNPPKKPAAPAAAIPSVPTATATTASSQKETLVVVGGQGGATKRRITPVAIPIDE